MPKAVGNILKMQTELKEVAHYSLPIGKESLGLNSLIGKKIRFSFDGVINCIATGEKIKKSYNNGYSYKALMTLAQCDLCIVKPELCHYDKGTCREPEWGEKHCMQPHIVYLSNSSHPKVGITREVNTPHRWIDQGAVEALPILRVEKRYHAGLIEVEMARSISDKTNWRQMLSGKIEEADLYVLRDELYEEYGHIIDEVEAEDLDQETVQIKYPVESVPEKIKSLSFDKTPIIEGTLTGIKGQYLIFDTGVLNIRKHQGYFLKFEY